MSDQKQTANENIMEKIVSLAKRRGFVFPGSEIYGGLAGTWDYGPLGMELKNNIKQLWWKRFVQCRDDIVGIDSAIIMNPRVWEASGHVDAGFTDPLVECEKCHMRFRADHLVGGDFKEEKKRHILVRWNIEHGDTPKEEQGREENFWVNQTIRDLKSLENDTVGFFNYIRKRNVNLRCPECNGQLLEARKFNLMFKTQVGPVEDSANQTYLRPETAQGMFVNFKNILDTTRRTLPFGIAQIGKVFRNEITPRDFIFRSREFEQMEIEYFVRESEWGNHFDHWLNEMRTWIKDVGIDIGHVHEFEVPDGERAHYSKRTVDFEYDFPFGKKELYGLAYRTDFDLKNHFLESPYREEEKEPLYPHVIEPTWGVDRTVLAVLLSAYREEENEKGKRVYLALKADLAPYKAAVFPLVANKPDIVEKAHNICQSLKSHIMVAWDDRGNIGKRYYSQDEIGTPFCITIDYQTLEDDTVTIRDRDTARQERITLSKIHIYIESKLSI